MHRCRGRVSTAIATALPDAHASVSTTHPTAGCFTLPVIGAVRCPCIRLALHHTRREPFRSRRRSLGWYCRRGAHAPSRHTEDAVTRRSLLGFLHRPPARQRQPPGRASRHQDERWQHTWCGLEVLLWVLATAAAHRLLHLHLWPAQRRFLDGRRGAAGVTGHFAGLRATNGRW